MSKEEKRPRGRPSQNLGERVPVRLNPSQNAAVSAWAKAKGVSKADVIRRAIDEYLAGKGVGL